MNAGALAERVYDALKARLTSGRMRPDEKLEPAVLAAELNSSVTPVRDALHRLCGERLVETRHSDGFHLPHVNEPGLRDLYAWNGDLLRLIMRHWRSDNVGPAANNLAVDVRLATPMFFRLFPARSRNAEQEAQIDSINDRLSAARRAEVQILPQLEEEMRALAVDFDHGSPTVLTKRLAAYHRRRLAAVPAIVRELYRARD